MSGTDAMFYRMGGGATQAEVSKTAGRGHRMNHAPKISTEELQQRVDDRSDLALYGIDVIGRTYADNTPFDVEASVARAVEAGRYNSGSTTDAESRAIGNRIFKACGGERYN